MTTTLLKVERQKTADTSQGDVAAGSGSETETYKVYFSDAEATGADARNATKLWSGTASMASGLPDYGKQLVAQTIGALGGTLTTGFYLTQKTATRQANDPKIWDVLCTYNTLSATSQPAQPAGFTSGDKYGVTVSMTGVPYSIVITKDRDGKTVGNLPWGEPFDPPVTDVRFDKKLSVQFWSDLIDQAAIDDCNGCVNSEAVTLTLGAATWIADPNTLFFSDWGWSTSFNSDGAIRYQQNYDFMYRADTWEDKIANMSQGTADSNGDISVFKGTGRLRYTDTSSGAILAVGAAIQTCNFNVNATVNFNTALLIGIA